MIWILLRNPNENNGIDYSSDGKSIIGAASTFSGDLLVPSRVESIIETGESESPFILCLQNLNSVSFDAFSAITSICTGCFANSAITSADMSQCSKLLAINQSLFQGCTKLAIVKLPPNLQTIKPGSFTSTRALKNLTIPDSCIEILSTNDLRSFSGSGIEKLILTENSLLQTVGTMCFYSTALMSLYIPQYLSRFDGSSFALSPIETITIHKDNSVYRTDGKVVFTGKSNETIVFAKSTLTGKYDVSSFVTNLAIFSFRACSISSIGLHDNIAFLGDYSFSVSKLTSFKFPPKITSVPNGLLFSCQYLESVEFHNNITSIGSSSFFNCVLLKEIDIPSSVTSIGKFAFQACKNYKNIVLPENLTILDEGAFSDIDSPKITSKNPSITVVGNILYSDNGKTLIQYLGNNANLDVKVPQICTKIGVNTFNKKKLNRITFDDNPNISVSNSAFQSSSVTSISFPSGLFSIGQSAMQDCTQLTSVTFAPNTNLIYIPDKCFYGCTKLINFVLPSSVKFIGEYSFFNCLKIGDIGLSDTDVQSIGQFAFYKSGLSKANLPSTTTSIMLSSFMESGITEFGCSCDIPTSCCSNCIKLTSITLNEGITIISKFSFYGCTSLRGFIIPTTLSSIQEFAFGSCTSLSSVELKINSNIEEIQGGCFLGCPILKSIHVSPNDKNYRFENGALTDYDQTKLITFLPSSDIQNFVVPSAMVSIGKYAFMGSEKLIRVMFNGNSIKEIGYMAFKNCHKLSLIFFSSTSLQTIGDFAFDGCQSLHRCGSVSVPVGLQSLFIERGKIPRISFSTECSSLICNTNRCTPYFGMSLLSPFIILFI